MRSIIGTALGACAALSVLLPSTVSRAIEIRVIANANPALSSLQVGPFFSFPGFPEVPSQILVSGSTFRGAELTISNNGGIAEILL